MALQTSPPSPQGKIYYTDEQREMVIKYYPTCRTRQEKLDLCHKVGIKDIRRLYNLACQLGLTRTNEDLSNAEFFRYMAGDKSVLQIKRRFQQQDEREILSRRESPDTIQWTDEDDKFLITHFGSMNIPQIALQRAHSETAVTYYARHLTRRARDAEGRLQAPQALRKPAFGYPLARVCAWLGLDEEELRALQATVGVEIRPLPTQPQRPQEFLVLSRSLAPFLRKFGQRLIADKQADEFFILEILETEEQLEEGGDQEGCVYLDHGRRCQNPWAGPCFGLFCDGEDTKCHVRKVPLSDKRKSEVEV
jgi:hypothetical protein